MEHLTLAASLACGGRSVALYRWLHYGGGNIDDMLHPDTLKAAGIPRQLAQHLHKWLTGDTLHAPLGRLRANGWQWLWPGHRDWPVLLNDLADPPGVLFVRGDSRLLDQPQLAMVGARHASTEGRDSARRFARALSQAGFVISSGLALGIDGAAHEGALQGGKTLAVLGHGPGPCYPPRHRPLAERIVAGGGALISEFPPGIKPRKEFFPLRNRLISGLSLATLVIEAALRSGSLITARLAAEQGREVFAMPGSIHNPLSKGCHALLRDGANWLESIDDILAQFGSLRQLAASATSTASATVDIPPLLGHFTSGINSLDQLQARSQHSVAELAASLSEMELAGWIERVPGGYSRRHDGDSLTS